MEVISVVAELIFDVTQWSMLDYLVFIIYVLPLVDIILWHSVTLHTYADDTQLHFAFDHKTPANIIKDIDTLVECIDDIKIILNILNVPFYLDFLFVRVITEVYFGLKDFSALNLSCYICWTILP